MERLALRVAGAETEVLVAAGAWPLAARQLRPWWGGRSVFLVAAQTVARLHGAAVRAELAGAARVVELLVPDGEGAKTVAEAERLWQAMLAQGGKRDSRLVALGGGSATDLAGFAAATFLRGIELVLLPTTLLGQVDAALGGKVAIDLPAAKNSVGAFHHPRAVVCDTRWLATVPRAELAAGLMEVVKMAALLDPSLFERVERDAEELLLANDPRRWQPIVAAAAAAKLAVVARDPAEAGERQLLNFGHTLGHALESAIGYTALRHGEAVGYGMLFALRLARRRGWALDLEQRLVGLIARIGLPAVSWPSSTDLLAAMARDKKAREGGLAFVLPERLGLGRVVLDQDGSAVAAELEAFRADPFGRG